MNEDVFRVKVDSNPYTTRYFMRERFIYASDGIWMKQRFILLKSTRLSKIHPKY